MTINRDVFMAELIKRGIVKDTDADGEPSLSEELDSLGVVKAVTNPVTGGIEIFAGPRNVISGSGVIAQNKLPISATKVFSGSGTALSSGNTVITQVPAEAKFSGARLIYQNFATSEYSVSLAKIAAAPTHQNDGSALTWKTVDVSAAIPAATGTGVDIVPGFMRTPVIAISSVPRSDGGVMHLLQTRSYFGNAGAVQTGVGATAYANFKTATGREYGARIPAGDLVTTLTASAPLEAGTWQTPAAIEFIYDVPSITIACCGDSIMRGQGSTESALGVVQQLAFASTSAAFVVSPAVYAVSGQKTLASHAIGALISATLKPNVLVMAAYSPNDAITVQADIDALWVSLIGLIQTCIANDVTPVVVTAVPENALTVGRNTLRLAQNARVMALPKPVLVCDFDAVIRDPSNSALIASFADSGDGRHLSTAGYTAEIAPLRAALSKFLT